jgi:tubulin delta
MLSLQIGQCGNQVGYELYSFISRELQDKNTSPAFKQCVLDNLFRSSNNGMHVGIMFPIGAEVPVARAVLVDMEPKVITQTIYDARRSGTWCYDERRQFSKQSGSANNWAYGLVHAQHAI